MLPLIGGGATKYQPVYVDDLADAVCAALESPQHRGKTFELGGPNIYSFKELMTMMLEETGRARLLAPIPFFIAPVIGFFGELAGLLPFVEPPITRDQIKLLRDDNIAGTTDEEAIGSFEDFGITPTMVEAVLPTYLVRFRKYGQFTEKAA